MDKIKTWKFRPIYGVIGHVGSRWISIEWPWNEDHRLYDCPLHLNYFGKKWCWGFRPFSGYQQYDWKHQHFSWDRKFKKFRIYPANYRERKSTCGDCWRTVAERYRNDI
jgi:hypothetical protein